MKLYFVVLVISAYHEIKADHLVSEEGNATAKKIRILSAILDTLTERAEGQTGILSEAVATLQTIETNLEEIKASLTTEQPPFLAALMVGDAMLRLSGGTRVRGRLEVQHNGRWGTVCDDDFTDESAAVFCKALGLPYASASEIHNFGGGGSRPILMDQVSCKPNLNVRYCSHAGWGTNNCEHSEDVGLNCV